MELEEKVNSSQGSSGASGVKKKLFSSLFNSKSTRNEAIIVSRVKKEIAESEQIENNIIISGLKKAGSSEEEISANDTKEVDRLLLALDIPLDEVRSHKRIRTKYEKTNLI